MRFLPDKNIGMTPRPYTSAEMELHIALMTAYLKLRDRVGRSDSALVAAQFLGFIVGFVPEEETSSSVITELCQRNILAGNEEILRNYIRRDLNCSPFNLVEVVPTLWH